MKKIIHLDMDAFYASVEIRDKPELNDKPVVISGPPNSRSVVCTCNYIAREYGIHSAMPSSQAFRLCPSAVFVLPRMKVYQQISDQIFSIYKEYTQLVETLSLDEAYLDVSETHHSYGATGIAGEIKERVKEMTGLTVSAGVSINKFTAKIASDWNKPDGLTVIKPEQVQSFLWEVPVRKFWGIGKKTAKKMDALGIFVGKDLYQYPLYQLIELFGKAGKFYYDICRGNDPRKVETGRERKSLGKETTFQQDIFNEYQIMKELKELVKKLYLKIQKENIIARNLTLKIRYANFENASRIVSSYCYDDSLDDIIQKTEFTLRELKDPQRGLRLAGITFSRLGKSDETPGAQLRLFET